MLEGPRAAKPEELPDIINLANEVFMVPRGLPPILGDLFPLLFNVNNLDNLRVIVENGKVVSHVGIWEGKLSIYGFWFKVGMIGVVCTRSDFRGRGYASALVMDALRKMKADRVDLVLISGDMGLYRRFGCFKSGIVYRYNISCDKIRADDSKFNIVPYDESRIMDVVSIYQREPVRYQRTLEEFKLLLESFIKMSSFHGLRSGIYLAMNRGMPLAYVAFSSFDSLKVWEYAGLRSVIPYLMAHILKAENCDSIEIPVPFHDVEMLNLLEECGLSRPSADSEASMLILNPSGFFEKAKRYLAERVGESVVSKMRVEEAGEVVKILLDEEILMLDPSDITLLFFDSPDEKRPREKIAPVRRFLSGALPMPTPIYGLNYI